MCLSVSLFLPISLPPTSLSVSLAPPVLYFSLPSLEQPLQVAYETPLPPTSQNPGAVPVPTTLLTALCFGKTSPKVWFRNGRVTQCWPVRPEENLLGTPSHLRDGFVLALDWIVFGCDTWIFYIPGWKSEKWNEPSPSWHNCRPTSPPQDFLLYETIHSVNALWERFSVSCCWQYPDLNTLLLMFSPNPLIFSSWKTTSASMFLSTHLFLLSPPLSTLSQLLLSLLNNKGGTFSIVWSETPTPFSQTSSQPQCASPPPASFLLHGWQAWVDPGGASRTVCLTAVGTQ